MKGTSLIEIGLNSEIQGGGTSLPSWLPLVPAVKVVTGRDGREFKNPGPDALMAAFTERKLHIPVDVNHAEELKAPFGEPSPAYGWVKELKEEAGVLMGRFEWNNNGERAIKNGEYKYYSPAYRLDKDRNILFIKSVGLSNSPNIDVPQLNREENLEEGDMLKKILEKLGLNSEATEEEAFAAIEKLSTQINSQNSSVEMVPKADYRTVLNRAEKAEAALAEREETELNNEASAAIDQAIKDRKIAPASKDYYLGQCKTREGLNAFQDFVTKAPEVIAKECKVPGGSPEGSIEVNAEIQQIKAQLGTEGME